jgi:hypothetical protein
MAEWSIATVLKTVVGKLTGGSNPSLSAKFDHNLTDDQVWERAPVAVANVRNGYNGYEYGDNYGGKPK